MARALQKIKVGYTLFSQTDMPIREIAKWAECSIFPILIGAFFSLPECVMYKLQGIEFQKHKAIEYKD